MGLISRVSSRTYSISKWERNKKRERTVRTSFTTWPKKQGSDLEPPLNFYNSIENSTSSKTQEYASISAQLQDHGCRSRNKICLNLPSSSVLISPDQAHSKLYIFS